MHANVMLFSKALIVVWNTRVVIPQKRPGVRKSKEWGVKMCKNTESTIKTLLYVHFLKDLVIFSLSPFKVERAWVHIDGGPKPKQLKTILRPGHQWSRIVKITWKYHHILRADGANKQNYWQNEPQNNELKERKKRTTMWKTGRCSALFSAHYTCRSRGLSFVKTTEDGPLAETAIAFEPTSRLPQVTNQSDSQLWHA